MGNARSQDGLTVHEEPRFLESSNIKILSEQSQQPFLLDETSKNLKTIRVALTGQTESSMDFIGKFVWSRGQERFEHQLYKMAMLTQMMIDMSQLIKKAKFDEHNLPVMLENITSLQQEVKDMNSKSFSRYNVARQLINQNDDRILIAMHHLWNDVAEIKVAYQEFIDMIDSKSEEEANLGAHILTPYLFNTVLLRFLTCQAQGIELMDTVVTKEDVDMVDKYSTHPIYRPSGYAMEKQFIRNERRMVITNKPDKSDAVIHFVDLNDPSFNNPPRMDHPFKTYLVFNDYKTLCRKFNVPGYAGRFCNYKSPISLAAPQTKERSEAPIGTTIRITSIDFDRLLARQSSILPDTNYGITMDFTLALPVQLVNNIVKFLPVKDLCSANQVNSVLYQACDHDDIWRKLVSDQVIVEESVVTQWYENSDKKFGVYKTFYTQGMQVALLESKLDSLCDSYLDAMADPRAEHPIGSHQRHHFKTYQCAVSCWEDQVYSHRLFEILLDRIVVNQQ